MADGEADRETVLEMKHITKRFPGGVIANKNVDFRLRRGEIRALLGENGAGKTTLMNNLYGLYSPNEGEIWIDGSRVDIQSPQDSIELGIGMIHQHFSLVPSFTVAENIILGMKEYGLDPDFDDIHDNIRRISRDYGLEIDPEAHIWQLPVGMKQRVEILKLLFRNARILILDEPTAVLTPQETEELFRTVRTLSDEGHSIIFITHKMKEVMAITDTVTVLRDGELVTNVRTSDTTPEELARHMVGESLEMDIPTSDVQRGDKALEIDNLQVMGDQGIRVVNDLSLEVWQGEILGVAGVTGNGQVELTDAVSGVRPVQSGTIRLNGKDITSLHPRERIKRGLSFIPDDRIEKAVAPGLNIMENMLLKRHRQPPFARMGFFLDRDPILQQARELIERFDVRTPGPDTRVGHLSGGNIQKVVLARELAYDPEVVVAFQPTRGLDIGAVEFVYQNLIEVRNQGKAVLLITGDLDELFTLSDRVVVIYEGQIVGETPPEESYREEIGLMMAGGRTEPDVGSTAAAESSAASEPTG